MIDFAFDLLKRNVSFFFQSAASRSIVGCIRGLKMNNKPLVTEEKAVGVTGCLPKYSGQGLFIGTGGGYGSSSKLILYIDKPNLVIKCYSKL